MGREFIDGNEAVARAAVAARCSFFASYPITPASTILHYLQQSLLGATGIVIQAEDEIASIGLCIGASMAGHKAMTATSGPGISLYSENIGLAIIGETPLVIVDVQRQGPATGSATKGADSDIQFSRFCTSSGLPIIALCPATVEEAFFLTYQAFNLAEKYRAPIFVLSNKEIGMTKETVDLSTVVLGPLIERKRVSKRLTSHRPHAFDSPEQVPLFSPIGGEHIIRYTTSTHDQAGNLTTDPRTIQQMVDHYKAKIMSVVDDLTWVKRDFQKGAETLIISYGITSRSVAVAIDQARGKGKKVSSLVLQTLWPVPQREIREAMASVKRVVVPEMNMGQYCLEIERLAPSQVEVKGVFKMNTTLLTPSEILEQGRIV